jgi:hypothetical protein
MKRKFNDDFYCRTVEEWENESVPSRVIADQISWSVRLLPVVLLIGGFVGQARWGLWLCIIAVAYVFVVLFSFLEELNENIRFVRHQNRAFRVAVRETFEGFAKYNDPIRHVTVFDTLATLHGHWEDPR